MRGRSTSAGSSLSQAANAFQVVAPADQLDLGYCLNSGQVFRWVKSGEDKVFGVDGARWYVVERDDDLLRVQTNGTADDFEMLFRLDWGSAEVDDRILERAPELAPYLSGLKGHRLMRPSDPVDTFFCFLCTPNNNIKRITQMVGKLAARGPVLHEVEGQVLHRFPEADVIASIPESDLRAEGFGYRGKTIPELARQLLARGDRKYLAQLSTAPYEEAHKELVSMKGIGPKLADCICLFALHHDEAVPVDTHIWQAMVRLYFPQWVGTALTEKRYYEAASFFRERLGSLAGWAHQYLFYENVLNWRKRA